MSFRTEWCSKPATVQRFLEFAFRSLLALSLWGGSVYVVESVYQLPLEAWALVGLYAPALWLLATFVPRDGGSA